MRNRKNQRRSSFLSKSSLVFLSMASVFSFGTPVLGQSGTESLVLDGKPYWYKEINQRVAVIPAAAKVKLVRSRSGGPPNCLEFERTLEEMTARGALQKCQIPWREENRVLCEMVKSTIEMARVDALSSTSDQAWTISEYSEQPSSPEENQTRKKLADLLQVSSKAIRLDSHPRWLDQPEVIRIQSGPESWVKKLILIGIQPEEPKISAAGDRILTGGLDVACDLLQRRASIFWTGEAEAQARAYHELPLDKIWQVREKIEQGGSLIGFSLLEKAAVLGSRLGVWVHEWDENPHPTLPTLEARVMELFQILFDPVTLDLKPFASRTEFDASFVEPSLRLNGSWIGNVE